MLNETREGAQDRFDRNALLDAIQNLVVRERDVDPGFEHIQRGPALLDVCRNGCRLTVAAGLGTRIVEGQITFSERCDERAPTARFLVTRDPDDATAFQYDNESALSLNGVANRIVQDFLNQTGSGI